MRTILIAITLFLFSTLAYAQDHKAIEIKFREAPTQLFEEVLASVSLPILAKTSAEFSKISSEQGYTVEELKQKMQLLARLYLDTSIKEKHKYTKAESLIKLLEVIGTTTYDEAYLQMLTGRYIARSTRDYKKAIPHYEQSINTILPEQEIESQLLKLLAYDNLGNINRIIRQDKPALVYLTKYREMAYQLRDDYFIAQAEASLGSYYNKLNQLTEAVQHYSEALRLSNRQDRPFLKADLQLQLARVYRELEFWDDALQYAHEAAQAFEKLEKNGYRSNCMTVIAMIHANQGHWNQAIDYYLNAQQLDLKNQNVTAQALNFHNLGEAYFNSGNSVTALDFLLKSNALFVERKSKHYQVYSDLLIAQVTVADKKWELASKHATSALSIAEALSLRQEQIEALEYSVKALRELKQYDEAFNLTDKLIALSQMEQEKVATKQSYTPSILAEQKLKLKLNQIKREQSELNKQLERSRIILITVMIAAILISLFSFNQWRMREILSTDLALANETNRQEPVSALPGYRGFIEELDAHRTDKPKAIALISLTSQMNNDIHQGLEDNSNINKIQMEAISSCFSGKVFLVRPGLFVISVKEPIQAGLLLEKCRVAIDNVYGSTSIHMGYLPMPLLTDPQIKLTPEVHFSAAQMTLAAAFSLGTDKDYFVTLKALNFAPSAIFSTPLYLHLEKGIVRGLLKVETNGDKKQILWPKWESDLKFQHSEIN